MLPQPAGPQWDEVADFLEMAGGFALAVLIFPSQPHAEHWQSAIAEYLSKGGRTLQALGPFDSTNVHRVAEILCYEMPVGQTDPLWVPLCQPPMAPDAAAWPEALRRALVGLNQTRNLITQRHPRILILAGTHELLEIAPRIAPDMWSIRRLFLGIRETEKPAGQFETNKPQEVKISGLFQDEKFLPTLEETQALLTRSRNAGNRADELRALNNIVKIFAARRDLAGRDKAVEELAHVAKSALTEPPSSALSVQLNNIGETLRELGRFAEAEPLLRRSLTIDEASYDESHPNVDVQLNNLAQLLQDTNRLAEAEPLIRRALEIGEQSYGPSHPNVATHLNNLAQLLQATNRLAEAEPLMRRALEIAEQSYGKSHPTVAIRLNNLASLLKITNRLAEAEPMMRRALEIDEQSYGESHPTVARDLNNLAQLLKDTNRLAEAEPMMRRALEIDEQSYGESHPAVARDLNNLASLLQDTKRLAEAEPLMRRALEIDEQSYGKSHPEVATDLNNLAQMLNDTNRLAEAEPLMLRALEIDEQSYGKSHPDVARDLNNLALLLKDTNRLAEAEPLMRRALEIDEQSYGPSHPKVAIRLSNLALLLQATNRLAEAEPLMRRAVFIAMQFTVQTGYQHRSLNGRVQRYAGFCQQMEVPKEEYRPRLLGMCREAGMDEETAKKIIASAFE